MHRRHATTRGRSFLTVDEAPSSRSSHDSYGALREARPLSEQLTFIHDEIGLKDRELSRLAKVTTKTIREWRRKGEAKRSEGLDDLRAIIVFLLDAEAMEPRFIGAWLRSRNRILRGQRPLEALRDSRFAQVWDAADVEITGVIPLRTPPANLVDPPLREFTIEAHEEGSPGRPVSHER